MSAARNTRGFTMMELVLTLVLASVLGAIITKLLVTTSHFYAQDNGQRGARVVARSASGLIESELRMVDAASGVVSADSASITVRVPYALGILCTTGGSTAQVSLLPMDSLTYALAAFSGFAVRDNLGVYALRESGVSIGAGTASVCTAASITTLTGGKVVSVSPAPAAAYAAGASVLLYQRITYRFGTSTVLPGRRALWRDVVASGLSEEIAAPFDASAKFRFYALNADTAQTVAPALANIRGIELVLNGASEKTSYGNTAPETAPFTTAVFFRNRVN